ncbi:unnamed protein product [Protopolystoma xenopodis]|uniref:Uncharacterized protein n=1 Tax=Protopolystoma xenopodis TaxID=117903 RepID=A0A3S5CSI5_9PLAT|nr:unnamed protein product [Protopolystoma xenopodis]
MPSGPAYYPEWWNIHTHRANHLCKYPVRCNFYGEGKSLHADCGRIGSVYIDNSNQGVIVVPQITSNLIENFHYTGFARPVVSPTYCAYAYASNCKNNIPFVSVIDESNSDFVALTDYGLSHLLDDPIYEDQACAACLLGKIQGILRSNRSSISERKSDKSFSMTRHRVQSRTESKSNSTVNKNQSSQKSIAIIRSIIDLLNSASPLNNNECLRDSKENDFNKEEEVVSKLNHLAYGSSDSSTRSSKRRSIRNVIEGNTLNKSNVSTPPRSPINHSDFLMAFEPLVNRLASRKSNPAYLGKGLLSKPSRLTASSHPCLLWSPPRARDRAPNLYLCSLDTICKQKPKSFVTPVKLPTPKSLAGCRLFELDSVYDTHDNLLFCARASLNPIDVVSHRVILGHISFRIRLDQPGEQAESEIDQTLASSRRSELVATSLERIEKSIFTGLMLPSRVGASALARARSAELLVASGHASCWLSVGYGRTPQQLVLATPKRLITFDSRCSGRPGNELFSLNVPSLPGFGDGRLFSDNEMIYAAPTWLADTYALLGTSSNLLLLDARMPGRACLHWTNPLLCPPSYLSTVRLASGPAEYLLGVASQHPGRLAVVGLNLTSNGAVTHSLDEFGSKEILSSRLPAPQLVGQSFCPPSLNACLSQGAGGSGGLPFALWHNQNQTPERRLMASLAGCVLLPGRRAKFAGPIASAVVLTSQADLFNHEWFSRADAAKSNRQVARARVNRWIDRLFIASSVKSAPPDSVSDYTYNKKRDKAGLGLAEHDMTSLYDSHLSHHVANSKDKMLEKLIGNSDCSHQSGKYPTGFTSLSSASLADRSTRIKSVANSALVQDLVATWNTILTRTPFFTHPPINQLPTKLSDNRLNYERESHLLLDHLASKAFETKNEAIKCAENPSNVMDDTSSASSVDNIHTLTSSKSTPVFCEKPASKSSGNMAYSHEIHTQIYSKINEKSLLTANAEHEPDSEGFLLSTNYSSEKQRLRHTPIKTSNLLNPSYEDFVTPGCFTINGSHATSDRKSRNSNNTKSFSSPTNSLANESLSQLDILGLYNDSSKQASATLQISSVRHISPSPKSSKKHKKRVSPNHFEVSTKTFLSVRNCPQASPSEENNAPKRIKLTSTSTCINETSSSTINKGCIFPDHISPSPKPCRKRRSKRK